MPFGALVQAVVQLQILGQERGVDAGNLYTEAMKKAVALFQRLAFVLAPFPDKTIPKGLEKSQWRVCTNRPLL